MSVSNPPSIWRERYAHPCEWEQTFPPLSLPDMFADAAARHGEAPLVDFLGRRYSYRSLLEEARAFAAGLQKLGIARGERIGLFLPNVPIYVPAYFGALIAGVIVVNFSPLYTAVELEAQVVDSGVRMLVTVDAAALLPTALEVQRDSPLEYLVVGQLPAMLPRVQGWAMRLFLRRQLTPIPAQTGVLRWEDMLDAGAPAPVAIDPERDIALLQYTGGTTGVPKGAILTHQNLTANARQLRVIDTHRDDRDVVLGVLPLFHVFANTCILNRTIANGGMIAMLPKFDTAQVLATIARVQPTSIFAVPTMLQALLDHPAISARRLTSVRACISGGAPLPMPVKVRFEAATGTKVLEGYGLTESSGVVTTNPLYGGDQPGTIGQPLPGTRVRLLDKEDATRDAPLGEPGELAVQGPQIMQGYWHRPDAAATAFAMRDDGPWLRTGDIAVLADDGFLKIVDRSKDMIAVGGFKVFPSQVEAVLLQHPAVREALVIGVPDDYRGEMPRAFVSLKQEQQVDGEALRDWLNMHVGKHERVDAVVIRESLPKTTIGKLDRKALKAEVGSA
ncbi:MAG: long-chain fatty acid--CoA ligase [Novosphingobium sp.]